MRPIFAAALLAFAVPGALAGGVETWGAVLKPDPPPGGRDRAGPRRLAGHRPRGDAFDLHARQAVHARDRAGVERPVR